jgi:AcrR family transcriptional regulator
MTNAPKIYHKEDRRITRTRIALRSAFRDLVKEKGFNAVTIEEITERANVGRTTFYLHYRDKEDLLLEDFEYKLSARVETKDPRPLIKWFSPGQDNLVRVILEMVQGDADFFRAITKEGSNKIFNRFRDIHGEAVSKLSKETPAFRERIKKANISLDFILNYYSGALWSCITWWVEQDLKPDIDEMTKLFLTMFAPGLAIILLEKNIQEIIPFLTENGS